MICYESLREDENLVRTCYKAVDFYRKSRMEQQVSGIYVKLYPALAELGREKEAEKAAWNIEATLPENSYNMQVYRRIKTNRLLWESKYREAYTLYKKTAPHLESLNLTGYERQAWSFTKAVIALGLKYTDKSGHTKLSEEESHFAYSEDFGTLKERCSKLKDKWGVKPFLKSVVFINALMDEDDDLIYYLDNYEAIQRFLRRYLGVIRKQSPRAGAYFTFVFKLWNLPPADKFEKLAGEVRQELAHYAQPSWSSDLGTLEFIKLEELIEMILAFYPKYLKKRKLK
jgi:hypothetical protein